jgi:hypothetical protein
MDDPVSGTEAGVSRRQQHRGKDRKPAEAVDQSRHHSRPSRPLPEASQQPPIT